MKIIYVVRYISRRGEEIERYFHTLEAARVYVARTAALIKSVSSDDITIYEAYIPSWSLRRVDKEY